jgi:hypothetical protein
MIITRVTGGLGNQLFQYAMARGLAERHKTELLLDTSGYGPNGEARPNELAAFVRPLKLLGFRIRARVASPEEIAWLRDDYYRATTRDRVVRQVRRFWPNFLWNSSHIVERQYRFQPEALEFPDNVYLQGFWQSPKYFKEIAPLIREEIAPLDEAIFKSASQAVSRLKERFPRVVSLHVRRGDLAHAHETLGKKNMTYGAPVPLEYVSRALREFDSKTCFFIFSDSPKDIAWCRENILARNVEFSTAESDVWDFTAMTLCDDHIISNSTFSWWAAWLDSKPAHRVIAPRVWSSLETRSRIVIDDLLPCDWTII